MAFDKTTGKKFDTAERRRAVLALRRSGAKYRQIADQIVRQFGKENLPETWDERYAHKDVRRELDKIYKEIGESAQDVLNLELDRLDAALMAIWRGVQRGDLASIDRLLRIMDRRAKMLGLDAPAKSMAEISGPSGAPVAVEANLTHGIDAKAAETIFDILEAAGAFAAGPDGSEDDGLHTAPADPETGGVPAAPAP